MHDKCTLLLYIYKFFFYRTGTIHMILNTDEDLDRVNVLHVYRCWQDACDGDTGKEPGVIVNILYMYMCVLARSTRY